MRTLSRSFAAFSTLALLSSPAYSQFMPITPYGDTADNIALGSGALVSDVDTNCTNCGSFNIAVGGMSLYENTTGYVNIAIGEAAMLHNTTGYSNTATGVEALFYNQTGYNNTASGFDALAYSFGSYNNSAFGAYALLSEFDGLVGHDNTASGVNSLSFDSGGSYNTASGSAALIYNTDGNYNTAFGTGALSGVSIATDTRGAIGSNNTGIGSFALYSYSTGSDNTASGMNALYFTTTGSFNTASGLQALYSNVTGNNNTASGVNALYSTTNGSQNTASGRGALQSNTTGSNNIAEGFQAGYNLTTGNDNIDIGNKGVAAESNTIRIGTAPTQNATYIAGIATAKVTGSAVYVTATGQLGVLASSERFKTAIVPMGSDTAKLAQLRPVSFKLKSDTTGTRQYGLIAEEVAKVYPELVIRDQNGRIDGVRYDELAPMLLNEMQQQQATVHVLSEQKAAQAAEIRDLKQQQRQEIATQDAHSAAQDAKINQLLGQLAELHSALATLQTKEELLAQR
jgi:hypothetical protein